MKCRVGLVSEAIDFRVKWNDRQSWVNYPSRSIACSQPNAEDCCLFQDCSEATPTAAAPDVQHAAAVAVAGLCLSHSVKAADVVGVLCGWLVVSDRQVSFVPHISPTNRLPHDEKPQDVEVI